MKTKLNTALRAHLKNLVNQNVTSPDTAAFLTKVTKDTTKMLLKLAEKQWPAKEMKILAKHDCARPSSHLELIVIRDDHPPHYEGWALPDETDKEKARLPLKPYAPYGNRKLRVEDAADVAQMVEYWNAKTSHEAALGEKSKAFMLLINHAKNLEQVEDVWPLAKRVRLFVPNMLPAVPIEPLQEQVKVILAAEANSRG